MKLGFLEKKFPQKSDLKRKCDEGFTFDGTIDVKRKGFILTTIITFTNHH